MKLGSELNESAVAPPKYDFEEMLQRALEEQGGAPASSGGLQIEGEKQKALAMKRSKTTRPQDDNSFDEDLENAPGGGTIKNKAKKDNLKKR